MYKIKITKDIFSILHEKIIEKCEKIKNFNPNGSEGAELYGFGLYKNKKPTVKYLLAKNPRVKNFIITYSKLKEQKGFLTNKSMSELASELLNGKYLYDRRLDYEKRGLNSVLFTGIYSRIYFLFLGYKNIDEFLKDDENFKLIKGADKIKNIQEKLAKSHTNSFVSNTKVSELAMNFDCYYYNYHRDEIGNFLFEINSYNNFYAVQKGFHYAETKEDYINARKIFVGNGIVNEKFIHFNLLPELGGDNFVNITLYTAGLDVADENTVLLKGALTTISAHGYILSVEVFLIKKSSNYEIYDKDVLSIKRYLNLQRRAYRITTKIEQTTSDIIAKRYDLDILEGMISTWRIWSITKKGHIFQSKFVIKDDYKSYLETLSDKVLEQQVCILRISKAARGLSLYVSAHQGKKGTELQNTAIIKIPLTRGQEITTGVFCGIGIKDKRYTFSPIILLRDNTDFDVITIKKINIVSALPNLSQEKIKELYENLVDNIDNYRKRKLLEGVDIDEIFKNSSKKGSRKNSSFE